MKVDALGAAEEAGEVEPEPGFLDAIEKRLGWRAAVPAARQTVTLGSEA
jgi:hypothetical protein